MTGVGPISRKIPLPSAQLPMLPISSAGRRDIGQPSRLELNGQIATPTKIVVERLERPNHVGQAVAYKRMACRVLRNITRHIRGNASLGCLLRFTKRMEMFGCRKHHEYLIWARDHEGLRT